MILGCSLASIVATVGLFFIMPQDFLPSDDTGSLRGQTEAANGTSFDQMVTYTSSRSRSIIDADPNVDGAMSAVGAGGPPRAPIAASCSSI